MASASAIIAPRQTLTTNATLFTGSQTCTPGEFTLTGTFTEDTCFQLRVMSYLLQDLSDVDCTFHSFTGKACETETGTTPMPAGDGTVCIHGVVDGGTGPVSFAPHNEKIAWVTLINVST